MTLAARATLGAGIPAPTSFPIGASTVASSVGALAQAADSAALDNPTGRAFLDGLSDGGGAVYALSYTPRSNSAFVRVELALPAVQNATSGGTPAFNELGTVTASLAITDGTNTIPYTDGRIPTPFSGGALANDATTVSTQPLGSVVRGTVDVAALSAGSPALDPTVAWSFQFTVTLSVVTHIAHVQLYDLPRWVTDESQTGLGMAPGDFLPDVDISDATTTQLNRVVATLGAARTMPQAVYLALAWEDGGGSNPTTTSTTYAAIANLSEAAGAPMVFTTRVRQISTGNAQARWRVRYYSPTQTLYVQMTTGAGTYTATLASNGGYAWSAWQTGAALVTSGTNYMDTMSFQAKIAAAGQAYISGIVVEGTEP